MARQGKAIPARKQRDDESLLLRSAESLGRMIGTLQRQLDGASRSMAPATDDVMSAFASGNGVAARASRGTTGKTARATKKRAPQAGKTVKAGSVKAPITEAAAPSAAGRRTKRKTPASAVAAAKKATARKGSRSR